MSGSKQKNKNIERERTVDSLQQKKDDSEYLKIKWTSS